MNSWPPVLWHHLKAPRWHKGQMAPGLVVLSAHTRPGLRPQPTAGRARSYLQEGRWMISDEAKHPNAKVVSPALMWCTNSKAAILRVYNKSDWERKGSNHAVQRLHVNVPSVLCPHKGGRTTDRGKIRQLFPFSEDADVHDSHGTAQPCSNHSITSSFGQKAAPGRST